jgi:hypothetical protein
MNRNQRLPAARQETAVPMRKDKRQRTERLQVILSKDELVAIDEFRFENRMPTRTAAVREILRRALIVSEKEERVAAALTGRRVRPFH